MDGILFVQSMRSDYLPTIILKNPRVHLAFSFLGVEERIGGKMTAITGLFLFFLALGIMFDLKPFWHICMYACEMKYILMIFF